MLEELQGLHIEPTNMCTLKCPRCSRTEFINKFPKNWTNKNLNLKDLQSFLDIDLAGKHISLCGNYGDAIYYDQLFDMVRYFKQQGSTISISTNGSYRDVDWWNELGDLLDHDDQIIFGIDGLPDNFTQYRLNADWTSILVGIKTLNTKSVKLVWQCIPFSYNEHQLPEIERLSQDLGFHKFFILDSDRWDNGSEWLTPSIVDGRSHAKIQWKESRTIETIDPQCKTSNRMHFISADGIYTPCCYMGEHRWYYKTEFYKNKDRYDISKTTITEVLTHLKDFYSTLEDAKLNYCTFNCPKL